MLPAFHEPHTWGAIVAHCIRVAAEGRKGVQEVRDELCVILVDVRSSRNRHCFPDPRDMLDKPTIKNASQQESCLASHGTREPLLQRGVIGYSPFPPRIYQPSAAACDVVKGPIGPGAPLDQKNTQTQHRTRSQKHSSVRLPTAGERRPLPVPSVGGRPWAGPSRPPSLRSLLRREERLAESDRHPPVAEQVVVLDLVGPVVASGATLNLQACKGWAHYVLMRPSASKEPGPALVIEAMSHSGAVAACLQASPRQKDIHGSAKAAFRFTCVRHDTVACTASAQCCQSWLRQRRGCSCCF